MPLKGGQSGGGGSGASDVRAGGAWYELYARDNLTAVLDKVQARVARFSEFMRGVGTKLLIGGAALGAGPLAFLFGGTARLASTANLARQFQVPIDLMGRLQYAAEAAGVSVDEVMNDTQGRFRDLIAQAPGIDPEQAKQALATQKAFRDGVRSLQDAMTPLLLTVGPLAKDVSAFVRANAAGVRAVALAAGGLLGLGVAAKVVGFGLSALAGTVGLVTGLFGALLTPIGAVALATGGLTALFLTQTQTGRGMVAELKEGFRGFAQTATEAWDGISAAMAKGDLAAAARVALAGISYEWAKAVAWWTDKWNSFKDVIVDGWKDVRTSISLLLAEAGEALDILPAGTADEVLADRNRERDADRAARAKDLADAKAEIAKARAEFARVVAVAKAPGIPGAADEPKFISPGQLKAQFDAVKGGFSGFAAGRQQFGYGDQVAKQTEIQKQIRDAAQKTAAEVAQLALALRLA